MTVGPEQVAILSGVIFAIGVFGVLSRRDAFGLLVSLAILSLASVVAFGGFAATAAGGQGASQGEVVALAVVVVCVTQSLVGAALVALLRRRRESIDVDAYDEPGTELG